MPIPGVTTRDAAPVRLRLPLVAPYDWLALHGYLAARLMPGVEVARPGLYARTLRTPAGTGSVRVEIQDGSALAVTARLPDPGAGPRSELAMRVGRVFDHAADPGVIAAGLSTDPFMAGLVAARPGLRVPGAWDGFELAVRAVLGQQVSVSAATRLAGRLVAAFGGVVDPGTALEPGLTHTFPTPEALAEADVALVLNMPRARGAAIRGLAAATLREPDLFAAGQGLDAAVARLTALPGIGPWTAQYVALRALREPDAFPASDIGLMRALEDAGARPNARALEARSAAWRPWRAYAVLHLWAHDAERMAARTAGRAAPPPGNAL